MPKTTDLAALARMLAPDLMGPTKQAVERAFAALLKGMDSAAEEQQGLLAVGVGCTEAGTLALALRAKVRETAQILRTIDFRLTEHLGEGS